MRITVSVFALNAAYYNDLNLVIASNHARNNYRYKRFMLDGKKLKAGTWNTVSFDYQTPPDPDPNDKLVSYVWYPGKNVVFIDDLKYEAFEPKK